MNIASFNCGLVDLKNTRLYTQRPVSKEFSGHFGMHPELGPLIHDAERNNGNINIRVNRLIQRSSTARVGDH
jgi:hypothetical protein